MNRNFFAAAALLGAFAVVWVGIGFVGSNAIALTMTVLIAAVYALGVRELHRFRQATATLDAALAALPASLTTLGEWLASLHPSLQNAVRLRIEGERGGLPGPALTPYLVGLLVMLGMLGTFVGMVVTFNGAVFALEGTADLKAIRAALAAPIKGLGLAFGTSVAGVAASAMLGLMSALVRRERLAAAHALDSQIATTLRGFSLSHQRQETFKAIQAQAQALPQVVEQLQTLMTRLEQTNQQLGERLLNNQEGFHRDVRAVYGELATSVERSLRDSLAQSARQAGESLTPVVETAMNRIAGDAARLHERVAATAQAQFEGLAAGFAATSASVAETWSAALTAQERGNEQMRGDATRALDDFTARFEQRAGALLNALGETQRQALAEQAAGDRQRLHAWTQTLETATAGVQREWQQAGAQALAQQQALCATLRETAQHISAQTQADASATLGELSRLAASSEELARARLAAEAEFTRQQVARMDELAALLRSEFGALRDDEAQRGAAAVARLGELQGALTAHLSTLGTALETPIARLIETASEAPRAAAEVIGQMRQEISVSVARDNALLEERARIMETLSALLDAIKHAAAEQREVIDGLVASAAVALDAAGSQFAARVGEETAKLADSAAHVTAGAVEVASLGEAFGGAVQAFGSANETLVDSLRRIEGALDKSMARSDEQLAYYVAQAREIIDLSLLAQKEIFEELRRLPASHAVPAAEAG